MAILLSAVAAGVIAAPSAQAREWSLHPAMCHAVVPLAAPDTALPAFHCDGIATGYQSGSLWLRADLTRVPADDNDIALMVHNTRFDRLRVGFVYADGAIRWRQVGTGDFGAQWRAGGQIAFYAPQRDVRAVALVMRFDRLASLKLLRLRLMSANEANLESTVLAAMVGGALMLLLLGAVYNLSLGIAARRQFPLWQGAWAASTVAWGATWSQLHLLVLPGLAGAPSAQAGTALACLAITLATQGAVTALATDSMPAALRRITYALGLAIGGLGLPVALMRAGPIDIWARVLDLLTLVDLVAVTLCLTLAWRRGSPEARAFFGAWIVPMVAVASTDFFDMDWFLWGGGPQLLVLMAAAAQTLWLSIAATERFNHIRRERDRAQRAAASAEELASRDPLTGLRNRRGFMAAAQAALAGAEGGPVALLVLDVDRFKAINDTHGHDIGDHVLCTLADRLARWDGALCTVARFGGEEFAMLVAGLAGAPLMQFADRVREGIAACDHGAAVGRVSVSIGVAEAGAAADIQALYRAADGALYTAKQQGRDRVAMAGAGIRPAAVLAACPPVARIA